MSTLLLFKGLYVLFFIELVRHEAPWSRRRVRDPPLWAVAAAR
jgi:hypothetical protein